MDVSVVRLPDVEGMVVELSVGNPSVVVLVAAGSVVKSRVVLACVVNTSVGVANVVEL